MVCLDHTPTTSWEIVEKEKGLPLQLQQKQTKQGLFSLKILLLFNDVLQFGDDGSISDDPLFLEEICLWESELKKLFFPFQMNLFVWPFLRLDFQCFSFWTFWNQPKLFVSHLDSQVKVSPTPMDSFPLSSCSSSTY